MARHLQKGDEAGRRSKIMAASRAGDASLLPQLLARVDGAETYENRRHIVRALGKIGGAEAEAKLLQMLASERGLMLGDVARSLGQIGARRAIPDLRALAEHDSEWVRQNVTYALRRLGSRLA